jgi:Histidine kinase-, DNA gyrase B-, and HSP90-like ATPase
MKSAVAKDHDSERRGIDSDSIRIGKDVIEILTSGMYVSPVTVYREYIQNAADSIDSARSQGLFVANKRGKVSIDFDHPARSVTIRDNGAGIATRDAIPTLLSIGASSKRGSDSRGFRGVGRLSGLGYCRELEFRTKAAGEHKIVSVSWDCRALREHLGDVAFGGDLRRIVSDVVTVSYENSDDPKEHFFEVRLKDISRLRNDLLLNERLISHYLAQVGPVPFSPEFSFASQIEKRLAAQSPRIPLELNVAGEPVFRPYRDETVFPATSHRLRIENIEFLDFANVDGEIGAIAWIAHHEYIRSIPPTLGIRGLRARIGDLQVGEASLFDESFKESRFNGWSIGEIHIYDRRIVPNARRDNFEVNHHYYNLLIQLGPIAANITLHCRSASVSRNAEQIILNVVADVESRTKQKHSFDRAELSRLKSSLLRAGKKLKLVVEIKKRQQMEAKLVRLKVALSKVSPKRGASVVAFDEAASLVSKVITNREQAQKLIDALRRLCD